MNVFYININVESLSKAVHDTHVSIDFNMYPKRDTKRPGSRRRKNISMLSSFLHHFIIHLNFTINFDVYVLSQCTPLITHQVL